MNTFGLVNTVIIVVVNTVIVVVVNKARLRN
jgi:hypothetical protein